jgi:acetyl-CoA acetyltransferase
MLLASAQIYDAFPHLPISGLDDLGFVPRREAGASIASATPRPGVHGTARMPTARARGMKFHGRW